MKQNVIVIVVPDGVGIKNYLYSGLLKYINEFAKVIIWSPLPSSAFNQVYALHKFDIEYKPLILHSESIFTRLFREAASFARLNYNANKTDNKTILINWKRKKRNIRLFLLNVIAELIGHWAKFNYKRILKLEDLSKKYWSASIIKDYQSDLSDLELDSIFITHQRVASLMPICIAAKALNIKTTTAIYSWDNLPKARLCVSTDYYALWSDWMKSDMGKFYPEISENKLKIVGTPQFEFYSQKNRLLHRELFAKKYGLNPNSKWLCFSGDDIFTSPYDPYYLRDIADAISMLDMDVQLIFRRCPVDFSSRYDEVLQQYSNIIVAIDPLWHTDSKAWIGYFSKVEDIDLQVNLAYHCDGVINLGSTMALDFATFDKPCLYLNYDTVKDSNWNTANIYKYHHFKSMEGLDPVGWINSKSEIKDKITSILNKKLHLGKDRKEWLKKIVLCPLEDNSKKLASILE